MKEKQNKNFVQVNYDLLATTKLSSTQKLFISYIIGWQKNRKICKETNNNLALRFGMKYGGIRSVLTELNKFDFFESVQKNYDGKTSTSGHEITVDVDKLNAFLTTETRIKKNDSTKKEINQPIPVMIDIQHNGSNEDINENISEVNTRELNKNNNLITESKLVKHHLDDRVNLYEVLNSLGYNEPDDVMDFIEKVDSSSMIFKDFIVMVKKLYMDKKYNDYTGIIVTDEVLGKINQMIQP